MNNYKMRKHFKMPLYDYVCKICNNKFEHFNSIENREDDQECPDCGGQATWFIQPPNIKLNGCDPAFPTAWDKWEKTRKQKMAQEKKQEQ